jgi:serine protease Do
MLRANGTAFAVLDIYVMMDGSTTRPLIGRPTMDHDITPPANDQEPQPAAPSPGDVPATPEMPAPAPVPDAPVAPGPGTPVAPVADEPAGWAGHTYPSVPYSPEPDESPATVIEQAKERRRTTLTTGCLTVLVSFAVAAVVGLAGGYIGARAALGPASPATSTTAVVSPSAEPVAAAAAAALPSVVNIDVTGSNAATGSSALPPGHPSLPATSTPFSGQASGVAYKATPGGGTYIITNNHVVEGASTVVVTTADGVNRTAKVVGADPDTDIAVVSIDAKVPLIALETKGTSLVVGQVAVAIGSPFGLQHSVTSGVISGTHRSLPDSASSNSTGVYPLVDVIQTDAAINPGNSGGALVDRTGRLVGINSAIYSDSGSSAGIGFAIPVDTATRVADELIATGVAKHPFLGIVGQTIDDQLAAEQKLPVKQGALVVEVTKGTGAEKAGLKAGDVVVSLDSTPIRSMDDLLLAVRQTTIGQKVKLGIYRNGKKTTLTMTVGDKPKL